MLELARAATIALLIIFAVSSLLVLVHELGHYLVARICRSRVSLVAIGFGPKLIQRVDNRGTVWRLALIPIGGYVELHLDTAQTEQPKFRSRLVMIHAAISGAGPIANLVLALFLYAGLSLATGEISFLPVASTIEPASAAEKAGFREGDVIISADGITVTSFEELRPILASRDQPVRFEIHRHDERLTLTATLSHLNVHGRSIGHLGISSHEMRTRSVGLREAFKLGVERSWQASVATVALCGYSIRTAAAPNPLATAINVAGLSRSASALGFPQLVACAAFLSVVLALSNLLPMPMLDGGAILVDIAELVRRRPASPATLVFIDRAGLAVIAVLFAFSSRHGLLV